MSDNTPRLGIAELAQMQEMDAATLNEAFVRLDAISDVYLLDQYVNTPPASPADGDTYITGGAPTGAWTGYAYKIAYCIDGGWRFFTPFNGLRAFVASSNAFLVYQAGSWIDANALIGTAETSIASAATCDLGAAGALFVQVTGTTAITSLGSGTNLLRFVRFAGALTLTHNAASLVLPGGGNIATIAGDCAVFTSDASGNWRCRSYQRATLAARAADILAAGPAGSVLNSTGLGLGTTPVSGNGALQVSTGAGGTQQSLSSNSGAAVGVSNTYNHDFQIASNATLSAAGAWTAKYTAATGFELRGDGTQVFWGNTGLTSGSGFSPAERARFGSDGSCLIGTTSNPTAAKLAVVQSANGASGLDVKATGSGSIAAHIGISDTASHFVDFEYQGSSLGYVYTDNTNFQFASTFATRFKAGGAGGVELSSGATAWSAISDYRLKEIAGLFEGAGAMVDAIPIYSARYKDRQQYRPMFLAHEAQAGGAGFAVTGEKDAVDGDGHPIYQTMQTTDPLVAALWAALRETRQALAQLQARVTPPQAAA